MKLPTLFACTALSVDLEINVHHTVNRFNKAMAKRVDRTFQVYGNKFGVEMPETKPELGVLNKRQIIVCNVSLLF